MADKSQLPQSRKEKIEFIKTLMKGDKTVSQLVSEFLPEKYIAIKIDTEGLKYQGNPITESELKDFLKSESKNFKINLIWVNTAGENVIIPNLDSILGPSPTKDLTLKID